VLKRKTENGERLYELSHMIYIEEEKLSHKEFLYRLGPSSRSYYWLREQAIIVYPSGSGSHLQQKWISGWTRWRC